MIDAQGKAMRSFIVIAMFTASLAHAGWLEYSEVRDLKVDAEGASELVIDAGAGSLTVTGGTSANTINVTATIQVDESNDDKARNIIETDLTLTLTRDGDRVHLRSFFRDGTWFGGSDGAVKLDVDVPKGISLRIDDGAGSIVVKNVESDVVIDDGSGSIKIADVGELDIDDGSGSIEIKNAAGNVAIVDGSGSIAVRGVNGTVTINDGSGSITVQDVEKDLIIEEDGSGGLSVSDVRGQVDLDT